MTLRKVGRIIIKYDHYICELPITEGRKSAWNTHYATLRYASTLQQTMDSHIPIIDNNSMYGGVCSSGNVRQVMNVFCLQVDMGHFSSPFSHLRRITYENGQDQRLYAIAIWYIDWVIPRNIYLSYF